MYATHNGPTMVFLLTALLSMSVNAVVLGQDKTTALREGVLSGPLGKRDMQDLVAGACQAGDPSRHEMRLALLLRREEAIPVLQQRLREAPDEESYEILMIIQGQLRWREFESAIVEVLKDKSRSDRVRARAATACGLFQRADAVPTIREFLQTASDEQARQWAVMALGILGDKDSTPLVEALLNDPSPYVQVTAAMVLGVLGRDTGEAVAVAASRDEFFGMRCRAGEALAKIGTPEALDRLKVMAMQDESPTVRSESSEHLAVLEIEGIDKDVAMKKLEDLLAPTNPNPPRWAFTYLVDHFGADAKPFLHNIAETAGPLQQAAVLGLLQVESDAVQLPRGRRILP